MVSCRPVANAIFSLVPTPSTELTSTGCFIFGRAKQPPKDPISVRTPFVNVPRAILRIAETARSASSISTPASLYDVQRYDVPRYDVPRYDVPRGGSGVVIRKRDERISITSLKSQISCNARRG